MNLSAIAASDPNPTPTSKNLMISLKPTGTASGLAEARSNCAVTRCYTIEPDVHRAPLGQNPQK
jgi:hypothetical protein